MLFDDYQMVCALCLDDSVVCVVWWVLVVCMVGMVFGECACLVLSMLWLSWCRWDVNVVVCVLWGDFEYGM